jgi:hypothetical protein
MLNIFHQQKLYIFIKKWKFETREDILYYQEQSKQTKQSISKQASQKAR